MTAAGSHLELDARLLRLVQLLPELPELLTAGVL